MTYAELVKFHGASNHWRLGELSGTTAVDSIGGMNGTISGGVTLNGESGMSFNGTTGKIVTTANITLAPPFTIEIWFRMVANPVDYAPIWSTSTAGSGDNYIMYLSPIGVPQFAISYGSGGSSFPAWLGVLTDGKWHHFVWSYVAGSIPLTLYVDGILISPSNNLSQALVGSTTRVFQIGFESLPRYWNGGIDEVAIYPRALTQAEISSHYSTGLTGNYILTVQSIPIGPSVPVIAGQVYALPAVPVIMSAGAQVQTSLTMSGPYTNVPNGQVNGVYLKSPSNTNVTLSKYVISQ